MPISNAHFKIKLTHFYGIRGNFGHTVPAAFKICSPLVDICPNLDKLLSRPERHIKICGSESSALYVSVGSMEHANPVRSCLLGSVDQNWCNKRCLTQYGHNLALVPQKYTIRMKGEKFHPN